jgi:hypothetical protein
MLSGKFILLTVVGIVVTLGFGFYPAFNTAIRNLNTTGYDTEMLTIYTMFPYFLFFVILYAGYIVWRRGK